MTKLKDHLDSIRDRLPISVVIAPYVALKKRGRVLIGLCPFHNEKGPSFNVNDEKGFYHCFGCGVHGDHFSFLVEKANMSFMDSVESLTKQAGLAMPKLDRDGDHPTNDENKDAREVLYNINEIACQYFEEQLRATDHQQIRDYLKNRGMSGQVAAKFRLGYAPARGLVPVLKQRGFSDDDCVTSGLLIRSEDGRVYERFRDRVMFPIQDSRGRVVAFGGRITTSGEPKYLNSPETPLFHKGRQLYAHNMAVSTVRSGQQFVVVEGYMDVIALFQAGITVAVAPMGTALTPEQIILMWRTCKNPVLCFDGDSAGRKAAQRSAMVALEILKPGFTIEFSFMVAGEDPDSFLKKNSSTDMRDLLRHTTSLTDVLWQVFMDGRDLKKPEDKAKARQDLVQLSYKINDPEVRHFYLQDLNGKLQRAMAQNFKGSMQSQKVLIHQGVRPDMMKKIVDGQKILLATLVNHPTLLEEVAEQLMSLDIVDEKLTHVRNFLLDISAQDNHKYNNIAQTMRENGLDDFVDHIMTQDLYMKARFAHTSSEIDQARSGWQEIWRFLERNSQLKNAADEVSLELKTEMNQRSWQNLQSVKRQQNQLT